MENIKMRTRTREIVISALLIVLGLVLPKIFHMVNMAGPIFQPMFYPVILGALLLGWRYGVILGIILPLISSVLTGMPPLFPMAPAMAVQLGILGGVIGVSSKKFNFIISILLAQLVAGVGYTIVMFGLLGIAGKPFILGSILTGVYIKSIPGIIAQLILIPLIMNLFKRTKVLNNG